MLAEKSRTSRGDEIDSLFSLTEESSFCPVLVVPIELGMQSAE